MINDINTNNTSTAGDPEPELAFIFQELAANDEYKQYLRVIVRRLIKTYRIINVLYIYIFQF